MKIKYNRELALAELFTIPVDTFCATRTTIYIDGYKQEVKEVCGHTNIVNVILQSKPIIKVKHSHNIIVIFEKFSYKERIGLDIAELRDALLLDIIKHSCKDVLNNSTTYSDIYQLRFNITDAKVVWM